jgi:hypothetical protein
MNLNKMRITVEINMTDEALEAYKESSTANYGVEIRTKRDIRYELRGVAYAALQDHLQVVEVDPFEGHRAEIVQRRDIESRHLRAEIEASTRQSQQSSRVLEGDDPQHWSISDNSYEDASG